jgi:SAM-dependent methyltransferase
MKLLGPASRWLRHLIFDNLDRNVQDKHEIRTHLDVGCGEGVTTWCFARRYPHLEVTGTDFSHVGIQEAIRSFQEKNLRFEHDPNNSLLTTDRYDLISAFEVLEHVEDWQSLLKQMADACDKYLLLSFPTGRMRAFEVEVGHFRNFIPGEVERFLTNQGFVPVSVYYAGFPFYSPLYRELCNIVNPASASIGRGQYGKFQKGIALILYILFRFVSTKKHRGDQFVGLFKRQ